MLEHQATLQLAARDMDMAPIVDGPVNADFPGAARRIHRNRHGDGALTFRQLALEAKVQYLRRPARDAITTAGNHLDSAKDAFSVSGTTWKPG